MSLGNADIKEPVGVLFCKIVQSRSIAHGGSDRAHLFILLGDAAQLTAENGRKIRLLYAWHTKLRVERPYAVIALRLTLRRAVTSALLRVDMKHDRAGKLLRPAQHSGQLFHVMPVHRTEVSKPHVLKHCGIRQQRLFQVCLEMMVEIVYRTPQRAALEYIAVGFFKFIIGGLCTQKAKVLAHRADVAADRHPVVVQDDDQRLAGGACVVQPLVGKPAGKRPIADQRKHGIVFVQQRARPRHAERHGNRV